jgi:hypothetical protein
MPAPTPFAHYILTIAAAPAAVFIHLLLCCQQQKIWSWTCTLELRAGVMGTNVPCTGRQTYSTVYAAAASASYHYLLQRLANAPLLLLTHTVHCTHSNDALHIFADGLAHSVSV